MGRAMAVSDSSDDDSSSDADGDTRNKDLLADCFSKYARGGIKVSFRIVPRKRRANDEKPTKAKKRRTGAKVSEETKLKFFKCKQCDRFYSSKEKLERHQKKEHFESQKDRTEFKCQYCNLSYRYQSNLVRHEKKAHFESQKDKTEWKCQYCGLSYRYESNLVRHEKEKHFFQSPKTDKSNLTDCRLCNSDYVFLDDHYEEHHSIKYVTRLFFDDDTPLIISDIDTEDGKAPWFLNQKQKAMRRLNALKCRLCEFETEFPKTNLLKQHYITDHKVNKDYLGYAGSLFRIETGAHLKSDAQDRKRKSDPKNHTDETADDGPSPLNDCNLCGKNFNPLSKHYSTEHNINDVEDILFGNGAVLIISSANTENGKAAWFLEQRQIAKKRLNNRKCRLCISEPEFDNIEQLKRHYEALPSNGGHHVDPVYFWKMECSFRKEKEVHLKESSDSSGRSKRATESQIDETEYKCQYCGLSYSCQSNLVQHEKEKHFFESSNSDQSNLTECRLCNSDYVFLYDHYNEHHSIDYMTQLFFDDGTSPYSHIDTKNGKAPWFLKQKQKAMRRLNALKCRLCECETEFPKKNLLKQHYITDHKVNKDYLGYAESLFRVETGAHLKSDAQDRKRKSDPKNHTDETADDGESPLNDCNLCGKNFNPLSKHYNTEHNISNVEDILFRSGVVLIKSSANTENGESAWFLEQKEIAKQRLNNRKCRLCISEPEFDNIEQLKRHYQALPSNGGHHVHLDRLEIMDYAFRKEKEAHLKENSDSNGRSKRASDAKAAGDTTINKSMEKVDANMKSKVTQPENIQELRVVYICNCGVATDTYDASVDHAQIHLVRDYAPTTKHCPHCGLTFEEEWLEVHVSRHGDEEDDIAFKTINYDYTTLLSDKWFDMFNVLPDPALAKKIVAASIFKHTRSVNFIWCDMKSHVMPLYLCKKCELFVDPAKVENHIGACSGDELQRHSCSECEISFATANALKKHERDHLNGSDRFGAVLFNNKTDAQINKTLMQRKLLSEEESQESNDNNEDFIENPKRMKRNEMEENPDNGVMKFCEKCKRSVNNFDAHSAAHETEAKKRIDAISREDNVTKSIGEDAFVLNEGVSMSNSSSTTGIKTSSSGRIIKPLVYHHAKFDGVRGSSLDKHTSSTCGIDVSEKDVQETSKIQVSKDGTYVKENDSRDTVLLWDPGSDSDSYQEPFTTVETQAQINERTKDCERNNMERDSNVNGEDTPGEENDEDISGVVDVNDVQVDRTDESEVVVIDNTSQADIQAEAEPTDNDNDDNETPQKDSVTLNKNNQQNTFSTEGEIRENNQDTNEMGFSPRVELSLRQVFGANENETEELIANKDTELQSTQELLETLEGTENKEDSTIEEDKVQRVSINFKELQELVTRELIRQLTKK